MPGDDMTREEKKEATAKHTAAKKDLAAAVKKFRSSGKTKEDKEALEEVVTKYIRILSSEETKVARKLSDTFGSGRRTRRRSRRGTRRH